MSHLLTFAEVQAKTSNAHLLLGNGFSIAYDKNRFSFTNLLDSAISSGIIVKDSNIHRLFQRLRTSDFETVMRLLDDSELVVDIYSGDNDLQEVIRGDSANLKEFLVKVLTNNHPEKSTSVPDDMKNSCVEFLKPFKSIYTLNYDLLLYWATMSDSTSYFTDGFANTEESEDEGYVVFKNEGGNSFRVHYLHGALHIFDREFEIVKKTYNNTDISLIEQIRGSLNDRIYPVFISEGSSEEKEAKIIHNAYLNHCNKSLRKINGDLVIYGASLKENDTHIVESIVRNPKLKNLYFGVSDPDRGAELGARVEQYNSEVNEGKRKELFLFDYRTVDVWHYPVPIQEGEGKI